MSERYAFATLITSDHYLPGALAVAAVLKEVHPSPPSSPEVPFETVCIVTPETVDVKTVKLLRRAFDVVIGVEVIEEQTAAELQLLGRPDLYTVLTKLHVFRLTQYDKVIFLDADVLPIRPLSHLFALPYEFSAVPDVGWPDIFNSGVMVLTPGEDKFSDIMGLVKSKGSWDGGDQGVLNEWRGSDWHRLSFTYNTTPTAAYTYAPAYERFGSQISAIHFIGPNKPWQDLPYRAPSSASQQGSISQDTASFSSTQTGKQHTYAYVALLDRWFDVYDRHYRRPGPKSEQEFEARRYENIWDEPTSHQEDRVETMHVPTGSALGLDELRKLALEGGSSATRQDGDGEYRSLPLEGRIDLMRPKREAPPEIRVEELQPTAVQQPFSEHEDFAWQAQFQQPQVHTPGLNEVPPSPHIAPVSLPPSAPSTPGTGQQIGHDRHHWQQQEQQSYYQLPPLPSPSAPSQRAPSPQAEQQHHVEQYQHRHQPPPPPQRPHSPPLLSWNPAVEPPPNVAPTPSAFPTQSYFPNVWDMPPSSGKLHSELTGQLSQDSSAFFQPPPPGQIPERLIQEGHYTNVMGAPPPPPPASHEHQIQSSHIQPSHSLPDVSKVHKVFPWEEKPQHRPGRVFPEYESNPLPSITYIEDMPPQPEQQPESVPESPVVSPSPKFESSATRTFATSPSVSSIGFPGAKGFNNAWDSVPSIQKYAARLVKPAPHMALPPVQAQWTRRRSDSYRSRGEQSDANSMDGDVEDEVDDDDEGGAGATGRFSSSEREDDGKSRRERERSGSKSPPSGASRSKTGKKDYRSFGVQTPPKDVRSVAIQVSQPNLFPTGNGDDQPQTRKTGRQSRSRLGSVTSNSSSSTQALLDLPTQPSVQDIRFASEQTATGTPSVVNVQSFIRPPSRHSVQAQQQPLASGMISPRLHDTYNFDSPSRTPPSGTPGASSPATTARQGTLPNKPPALIPQHLTPAPPIVVTRSLSTETDSTVGPQSPEDSPPALPGVPTKKTARRIWDPATGVDVFKRGSEEVLARFLRMGSWDDEQNAQTQGGVRP